MMTLVNDLGVDPNEWFVENDGSMGRLVPPPFSNPLDSMPLATDNPRPEEEIADWFDESDDIESTKTLHQEMYELATKNGTTLTLGGSENASRI